MANVLKPKIVYRNINEICHFIADLHKNLTYDTNLDGLVYIAKKSLDQAVYLSNLNGLNRDQAIILGCLIKIKKLYTTFTSIPQITKQDCDIYQRAILESYLLMRYMIDHQSNPKTFESFISSSYTRAYRALDDSEKDSPFSKYDEESKTKIKNELLELMKDDGISEDILNRLNHTKIDGKSIRQICEEIAKANEPIYYLYSKLSDSVHLDWREMRKYSVAFNKDNSKYYGNLDGGMFTERNRELKTELILTTQFTFLSIWCYLDAFKDWDYPIDKSRLDVFIFSMDRGNKLAKKKDLLNRIF